MGLNGPARFRQTHLGRGIAPPPFRPEAGGAFLLPLLPIACDGEVAWSEANMTEGAKTLSLPVRIK